MASLGFQIWKNENETRIKVFMASPNISISGKFFQIQRVIQFYSDEIPSETSPISLPPKFSGDRTACRVTPCTPS